MLFRSIDPPLAGRCQSEVRSRGGDGLHLHNTVVLGVPSDREATSHRGGRATVLLTPAAPYWASEPWPFPLASLSDGGRLTASPKPPASFRHNTIACCCQTLRYHSDLFSKPRLKTLCSATKYEPRATSATFTERWAQKMLNVGNPRLLCGVKDQTTSRVYSLPKRRSGVEESTAHTCHKYNFYETREWEWEWTTLDGILAA